MTAVSLVELTGRSIHTRIAPMNTNTRKLYQIRHTATGHTFGQTVGHKGQLKPRAVAARIAKRLRAAGIDARISPVIVNVTPEQSAYLARRYDAYTRRCLGL